MCDRLIWIYAKINLGRAIVTLFVHSRDTQEWIFEQGRFAFELAEHRFRAEIKLTVSSRRMCYFGYLSGKSYPQRDVSRRMIYT